MTEPRATDSPRRRKRALRRELVARILAMDPADRRVQEALLAERLPSLPGFAEARTVLLYVSTFPEEIETAPMLRQALAQGKRLACPRVDASEKRLRLHLVEDLEADLAPGLLSIREPRPTCPEVQPVDIDWVLVPGLAFDPLGYRLGRGGGYYDRLLPTLRPTCPRWAFGYEAQWVDVMPVEAHDQRLDGIVSPARTVRLDRENLGQNP